MLKKINRLSQVKLIGSKNISTPLFNIKYAGNNLDISRFAFVISKKIDKKATGRNILRRKFSSCIEEFFDRIETGKDFVIYPGLSSAQAPREKILQELEKILVKENKI